MEMEVNIIYEDAQVIVCEKPPKIPSQGDLTGDKDMLTILKEHLQKKYKTKNPYIGLVHRLDRPVGGVMVFAKTKEANAFLSKQIQTKSIKKKYLVVVNGKPNEDSGELKDFLFKQARLNMSKVVAQGTKDAKEAILTYRMLSTKEDEKYGQLSLLEIELKTGRHHQIRVQLSHAGMGIWGDSKYNKSFVRNKEWTQIALWSHELSFIHPKTKKVSTYTSEPVDIFPFSLF